jgi:glyoxylase-like metal-dependent hydrolase (beta-lactamase superfamily II)
MHRPDRRPFPVPESSFSSWDEILANPGAVSVEVFETGHLHISNHYFLNMKHPNAEGLNKELITVPVYCYMIRHAVHGHYLVDAGLDRSFQEDTHGNIRGILRKILWPLKSYQKKGQDMGTRIVESNTPLKGVFFTHLHSDHASGTQNLPKDIRFVVGKDEPYFAFGPLFYQDNFAGVDTVFELDFDSAPDLPPLGRSADIFGDGSFWAISTPGHRKGHVSFLVNGKEKTVLITGDACDIRLGFDRRIGPGFGSHNLPVAQRSLEKIRSFSDKYPQISVYFGHEITET